VYDKQYFSDTDAIVAIRSMFSMWGDADVMTSATCWTKTSPQPVA